MNKFYDWFFQNYWWVLVALFGLTFALPMATGTLVKPTSIYALFGLHIALFFFAQKQRLADSRLAARLLRQYNRRAALLQPKLESIQKGDPSQGLKQAQIDDLRIYFNLCSEAYYHYCNNNIGPVVWQSWRSQMRIYYYDPRIRQAWDNDLKQNTHYGFGNHLLK